MSVSLQDNNPVPNPPDPREPGFEPFVVLALALGLAVPTGLLVNWAAAVTVLLAVIGLLGRPKSGPGK